MRQIIFILGLLWALAIPASDNADARRLDGLFGRSTLTIATPDAKLHPFKVWIADNDQRRSLGFMFVKELDDDAGMLFIFPQPQPISMWMKNTVIPLDMLFVASDGTVTNVVSDTVPMSLDAVASTKPAIAVIELKGGTAAKLKIAAGARVSGPELGAN